MGNYFSNNYLQEVINLGVRTLDSRVSNLKTIKKLAPNIQTMEEV